VQAEAVEKMKKSARAKKAEKTIRFDEKSRFVYLTGFRKRKQERRKKAVAEALEKERADNIQVKKEYREEVRKNWRDMQRANALTLHDMQRANKALGGTKTLALTDEERQLAIKDGTALQESDAGDVPAAATTVAFEREEDDPFGDCEVTTTVGDLCPAAGASQDPAARLWLAVSAASSADGNQAEAGEDPVELYHRRRRRAETWKREEDRRKAALDRRVARKMKKSKGGGTKKKSRDKVATKTTAKARRRRAKKGK